MSRFELGGGELDVVALQASLGHAAAGACVTFEGRVRDHNEGRAVVRLEYQAHAPLALREGERLLDEAMERFGLLQARCVHRVGSLAVGDVAVWVGVSAGHRGGAFDACRWIIDELKRRVPIWKNEHYAGGASGWLHPEQGTGGPA
jgi:molybdopterin synthase catalytic subunit